MRLSLDNDIMIDTEQIFLTREIEGREFSSYVYLLTAGNVLDIGKLIT